MTNYIVRLRPNTSGIIVKPSFSTPSTPTSSITIKNQTLNVTGNTTTISGSNMFVSPNTHTTGIVVQPHLNASIPNLTSAVTIKNQVLTVSAPGRLDHLEDVIEGFEPTAGSTLVYHPDNDKYEVQRLQIADVDGPLDGGSF
jgi:hypothetical protein